MPPTHVGVVGCGAISGAYLGMARSFPHVRVVACADLNRDAARARAAEFGVPRVLSVDELIADPEVDVVLNLTVPAAHAPVSTRAVEAGKHTYLEKPLALSRDEAKKLLDAAKVHNVRVGCAPDTFLGAGLQQARKLVDDGAIGRPVAAVALWLSRGHEHWHPSPEFYYQPGGGPMLDMGPYYVTALLHTLGPARRVSGFAATTRAQREILSEPKRGKTFDVHTPDHVAGTIEFESGAVCTLATSFATRAAGWDGRHPIQLFGTKGTLRLPDPNGFDTPPMLCRFDEDGDEFREVEPAFVKGYGRSVGLADLAAAVTQGRPHRCSGELACAALDVMLGFYDSARDGRAHEVTARFERPAAMDATLPFGVL